MKFIADSMLGSLTRWLRLIGYDVRYIKDYDDFELIEEAIKKSRVLLTGDLELYRLAKKKGIEALLIKERGKAEMLAQVVDRYGLNLEVDLAKSRCPKCGSMVKTIPKEKIKSKVPPSTFRYQEDFWICTNSECEKVYWYGSHWKKIEKILIKAKKLAKEFKPNA